jgi:pyruvate,water dikinase
VLHYLQRMSIDPLPAGMAVMIQPVIPARCSGVIYTADPDTGNPWQFVVRATPGLSTDLLGGSGLGDSFRIEWDHGSVIQRDVMAKPHRWEATSSGVHKRELSGTLATAPALTEEELIRLSEVALRLDGAFSRRLDIEFVFEGEELRLVQARPLTALPPFFPVALAEEDRPRTWQRMSVAVPLRSDLPAGFITPLYSDLSDAELWGRYQPKDIVLTMYCKEIRDFHGYRYSLAEPIPLFSDYFDDPSGYEKWLEDNEPGYRRRWDRHREELAQIATTARSGVENTSNAAQLIPVLLQVRDQLWDLNSFAWSGPQSLGWMCDMLLSHFVRQLDSTVEAGPAIGGGMDSYTFEVTRGLQELGRSIHEASVRQAFENLPLNEIVPHLLERHPDCEFLAEFDSFCWQFGKTPPGWRGRPPFWIIGSDEAAMMHTVRCAWQGVSRDVVDVQRSSLAERDRCAEELRSRFESASSELRVRFDKMLEWARYWGRALNDRHRLTAGLLWERELLWQVGSRLLATGLLEREDELLILRREDLEAFASGASTQQWAGRLQEQRHQVRKRQRLVAPETLGATPRIAPAAVAEADLSAPAKEDESGHYSGSGIGSNKVTGLARKVLDLSDPGLLDTLGPDDVLILPHAYAFHYADWHSLMTLVKAVASPGQPSHHLAQVARECGVPVVGQIKGDLAAIQEGARVQVDARRGVVRVLDDSMVD